MEHTAGISLAERIESIKAGLFGALAAGLAYGTVLLVKHWVLMPQFSELIGRQTDTSLINLLISWSIAALSGFLFGITYRYVIRQDRNPHLRSGAVLAFGLVRGLAQIDAALPSQSHWLVLATIGLESILLFAVARAVLDWVIEQGWIRAFN